MQLYIAMKVGRNNEERESGLNYMQSKRKLDFYSGMELKKKKFSTNFENRRKRARNVY